MESGIRVTIYQSVLRKQWIGDKGNQGDIATWSPMRCAAAASSGESPRQPRHTHRRSRDHGCRWFPHGSAYGTKSSNQRLPAVSVYLVLTDSQIRFAFQRYPPSSSAAPRGCVPPAFTGSNGSSWLQGTGYSLRSRVLGSSHPAFSGAPITPLFDSTHAGGTFDADGERPYRLRHHYTAWRPLRRVTLFG